MSTHHDHPTLEDIRAFGCGAATLTAGSTIEAHIAECETCRTLLDETPEDDLIKLLRSTSPSVPGPVRLGGYDLLEELGRGGMGVVYRARQLDLNRIVALKMLRAAGLLDDRDRRRVWREAELIAKLRHPHIVTVYQMGETDGKPFLSMELIPGGSLSTRMTKGPLPPREAAQLIAALADAVHYAHEQGVIHRDLKPANILLTEDGKPKLVDFGLAKHFSSPEALTLSHQVVGTPSYMAPEAARGQAGDSLPALDIYSLGAVFYETLTGRPPFRAATSLETLLLVQTQEPARPRSLQPNVPADLETICLKALHPEASHRYATAADLAADLRRYLANQPILARPASHVERASKWVRRNRWPAAFLALAACALVVILAGILVHNQRLQEENARTQEAHRRADANYQYARDAIRGILQVQTDGRGATRRTVERQQNERVLAFYEKLLADWAGEVQRLDYVQALRETANLEILLERYGPARQHLEQANTLLAKLADADVDQMKYFDETWVVHNMLGTMCMGNPDQRDAALDHFQKASASIARSRQLGDHPVDLTTKEATLENNRGHLRRHQGRFPDALAHFSRAIALREEALTRSPGDTGIQFQLAENYLNLGESLNVVGHGRFAAIVYQESEHLIAPLVASLPDRLDIHYSASALMLNWGNQTCAEDLARAHKRYSEGIRMMQHVVAKEPQYADGRGQLMRLYGARAQAAEQAGQYDAAVADWDRFLEYCDNPAQNRYYRVSRAVTLARLGDWPRLRPDAEGLLSRTDLTGGEWYNLACCFGVLYQSPARPNSLDKPTCLARAITCLQHAADLGFFRDAKMVQLLNHDADLAGVRGAPAFATFLTRLDKQSGQARANPNSIR